MSSNIFIRITRDRAIKEAQASKTRHVQGRPLSSLDGVPLVHKDLINLEGETTTAGSDIYRTADPSLVDAPIAANLSAAGMICIGKVNLTEFAYSGLGLNPHFGTPCNPLSLDVDRVPGGSSSGTAVAVSAGIVPCGIGTDTGGSVRIPASFNGLIGFKPSSNRISKKGVFELSQTLDTVGPLAKSVEDCVLLDMALRGCAEYAVQRKFIKDVKICVPENVILDNLSKAVAQNFENSLNRLEDQGARIIRKKYECISDVLQVTAKFGSLTAAEAFIYHHDLLNGVMRGRIDRRVVVRLLGGENMTGVDVISLFRARKSLVLKAKDEFKDGIVAMPTTAITAPEIDPLEADDELFQSINTLVLRNTSIGNFLDMPGLAIPNGVDENGMPTSIMFSMANNRDDELLEYGLELERHIAARPGLD